MLTDLEKINGCLLGGALGDAFGAPVEGLMKLSDVRATFGPNGQQEFTYYKSFFDDAECEGVGVITDDTTMTMCSLAGMIDAVQKENVMAHISPSQWQYYLAWGSKQTYGKAIAGFVQMPQQIPDYLEPFLFTSGAGRGTMAGLLQGDYGTIAKPLRYKMTLGDRKVVSPNNGCGAMMRIVPMAFLSPEYDVVKLARINAAMTHGHADAINTAAATAILVKNALQYDDIGKALLHSRSEAEQLPQAAVVLDAWDMAEEEYLDNPASMDAINALGYRFKPQNPFTALPVFTQVIYALHHAARCEPDADGFKDVMRLAVNHAGDSDSVGAVAGNILGAAWGEHALPQDWLDLVMCKNEIVNIGKEWQNVAELTQSGLKILKV